MFLSGFADEAGGDFAVQIETTRRMGWKYIEARRINGKNLGTMSDAEFDAVCRQLDESGIRISCFGSSVANWMRSPLSDEDFESGKKLLLTALPRMRKLRIPIIRAMSFKTLLEDMRPDAPEIEENVFRKVGELVRICADAGILYGHENCMNYGGLSWKHTLRLIEKIDHPNFTLIFDTGNPVFNYNWIGDPPYALQSSWEFYKNVREFISYVHIKDGTAMPGNDFRVRPDCEYCYAGDGLGDVRAIVSDLRKTGYDGGFSIEPHLIHVQHDPAGGDRTLDPVETYMEYGRRFERLLRECGWDI